MARRQRLTVQKEMEPPSQLEWQQLVLPLLTTATLTCNATLMDARQMVLAHLVVTVHLTALQQ